MMKQLSYRLLILFALCFYVQGNVYASASKATTPVLHHYLQTDHHDDLVIDASNKHGKKDLGHIANARKHLANSDKNVNATSFTSLNIVIPVCIAASGNYYWNTLTPHLTAFLKSLLYPKHSFW